MHLLYLDESGSAGDAGQKYFVLAGISLFERQGYWIANELDKIAEGINPADPTPIELHGSPIFGGKKAWRKYPKEQRYNLISDALRVLASSHISNRVFACVVHKEKISPDDPVEYTFEQVASRFDRYLQRLHNGGDSQRGVMIFDKSTYETAIQGLAKDFRTIGHTWGVLRNLAEVPFTYLLITVSIFNLCRQVNNFHFSNIFMVPDFLIGQT